ncbi:hypothetical protein EJ06DRAFT_411022 [Trichodelitschia bisporula]|uniref:Uncharacterized protein n=1 Tax=Trichodelitschia bisporula TaxID=703511 RepID=A0A6G1HYH5_9PEZI|nr:hypothetical protein EJ06DRAFT_411022 [Trichodelitschia bisporula]
MSDASDNSSPQGGEFSPRGLFSLSPEEHFLRLSNAVEDAKPVLERVHRASTAIEHLRELGISAALGGYLAVHRYIKFPEITDARMGTTTWLIMWADDHAQAIISRLVDLYPGIYTAQSPSFFMAIDDKGSSEMLLVRAGPRSALSWLRFEPTEVVCAQEVPTLSLTRLLVWQFSQIISRRDRYEASPDGFANCFHVQCMDSIAEYMCNNGIECDPGNDEFWTLSGQVQKILPQPAAESLRELESLWSLSMSFSGSICCCLSFTRLS